MVSKPGKLENKVQREDKRVKKSEKSRKAVIIFPHQHSSESESMKVKECKWPKIVEIVERVEKS